MKKLSVIALAVAACMLFAIPAMAVDVDFSGHYRVRGFWESNTQLDDDSSSDAAMDMRLRIEPVIKIHDRLKVTTRFDGQDNRLWGGDTQASEDFGLERVFADIDFDMFALRIGRMVAGICGTKFCDSETEQDRIKVILKNIDPFYLDFTYAKVKEEDYYGGASDQDFDAYWLHGFFSDEVMTYGLLLGYYVNKSEPTLGEFGDIGRLITQISPELADISYEQKYWLFDPYFKGNFGPITVEAEAQWFTGDFAKFDGETIDYDAKRYLIDASFNYGMGSVGVGYAHADGQDPDDDDYTVAGGGGNDWEPLLILTSYSFNTNLGPSVDFDGEEYSLGNLNRGDLMKIFGFDIFYLYGNYAMTESVTLSAILGFAWADETLVSELDDELGWEFDVGVKWQIMDNLAYDAKLGYFNPGDFYDDLGSDDDTWSMVHSLVVTF